MLLLSSDGTRNTRRRGGVYTYVPCPGNWLHRHLKWAQRRIAFIWPCDSPRNYTDSVRVQIFIRWVPPHNYCCIEQYEPYQGAMAKISPAAVAALALNKKASWQFGYAFAGLIGVFILAHFGRAIFHIQGRRGTFAKVLAVPFRYIWHLPVYLPTNSNIISDSSAKFFFENSQRCPPAVTFFWF